MLNGPLALVVDDDDINLIVAREVLKGVSVNADLAGGGAEAIELCRKNRYDFILMDHLMPGMDGVAAARHIRSITDAPIIALTGNEDDGASAFFKKNGFAGYLKKPIDVTLLTALLAEILPGYSAEPPVPTQNIVLPKLAAELELDMKKAVANMGGSETGYLAILRTFAQTTPAKLNKLDGMASDGRWDDFRIAIHAQKGALFNVGADILAEKARLMEIAARDGDVGGIPAAYDVYRAELFDFCKRLGGMFPADETPSGEATEAEQRRLAVCLKQILGHLDALENDEALEVLSPMLAVKYGEPIDSSLASVCVAVKAFDYDGAAGIIHHMLKEGNFI